MKTQIAKYISIAVLILLPYSIFVFLPDQDIIRLTAEDNLIESLGAIFLFATSIIFFIVYARDINGNDLLIFKTKKNIFYLLLALLFFWAGGEEISWGQRIFNISTPQALSQINDQQEITIHNLKVFSDTGLLNANHLFTYFWVSFCLIVPIIARYSPVSENWFKKINLPLVPIWLAVFFVLSFSTASLIKYGLGYMQSVSEVKETSICSLFLIFSIISLTKDHR
jgi:hypothetical protein